MRKPDEADEPDDCDDDGEMLVECPYCDGEGTTNTAYEGNGVISFDCPECMGTGWY